MAGALTAEQLFDSIAIRVNGPRAWSEEFTVDWDFTDLKRGYRMVLSNGALSHWESESPDGADLTLTLTKAALLNLLASGGLDNVESSGDQGVLRRLLGLLDEPDPGFGIVTP
jgi:alkyl sulfatase BDS1-like metallo-beta-lactamase superfamily hydrolase